MQDFLDKGCFRSSNPPNAAIDVMSADKENNVVVVELLSPIYNADAQTLQYTARILKDINHSIDSLNTRRDDSIPDSFDAVALFIDDCSDFKVSCGTKDGHKAGEVTCCSCWSLFGGCDFEKDCCSFNQCRGHCTNKYGSSNNHIEAYDGTWVNDLNGWWSHQGGGLRR